MSTKIEKTKRNYTIKIAFLDEDNKEIYHMSTNTNLVEDLYAMHGVIALQELYNTAISHLNHVTEQN